MEVEVRCENDEVAEYGEQRMLQMVQSAAGMSMKRRLEVMGTGVRPPFPCKKLQPGFEKSGCSCKIKVCDYQIFYKRIIQKIPTF